MDIPTDSISAIELPVSTALKDMTFEQFISTLVHDLIHFAISLAVAILVFYVGKFLIRKIYNQVSKIMVRRHADPSLVTFVLSLVNILLYFLLTVTVIGILGIETSSFLALFASAGVAIGMALSGTLQNFAGGVLILLLKPFKVGDYIEAQGFAGTVTRIEIFNTLICTPDNKSIIIPNGALSTGSINNFTTQPYRRIEWSLGISYGEDVEAARKLLLSILASDPKILTEQPEPPSVAMPIVVSPPAVVVSSLGDSSVNLSVRAWVKKEDYWSTFYAYNEVFYRAITDASGLSFPFPQLDVHLDHPASAREE